MEKCKRVYIKMVTVDFVTAFTSKNALWHILIFPTYAYI